MADEPVQLQRIQLEEMVLPIRGLTPLVTHNFSEKARKELASRQQQKTRTKKAPKDPQAEYEAAFYRLPDGQPGFPASGFKAATVGAVRLFDDLTMVSIKQAILVIGEGPEQLVPIDGEPEMWEAPVRVGMGVADLRYRPRFWPWSCELRIRYVPLMLSKESVVALVDAGGLGGIGEWRPSAPKSSTGSYGTFQVHA